jgi:SulP family sulfate permease
MVITFLATLFLHLEFAVLTGILASFAVYVMRTSVPKVTSLLPDENFRHFVYRPGRPSCPQLAILEVSGDLYFGAVSHVEEAILQHLSANPDQRHLLLRMHSVDLCDFSGIHALETIEHALRERGGDLFMVRLQEPVLDLIKSTGLLDELGEDHYLSEDEAVSHLFHTVLDPAICIYECDERVFKECRNLPKQTYIQDLPLHTEIPRGSVATIAPEDLWQQLCGETPPLVIDVREAREFRQSHVPQARLVPLPHLLGDQSELPSDQSVVFVCRGGRRSTRAAYVAQKQGYGNVAVLRGGMLAWEAANLLSAVDDCRE